MTLAATFQTDPDPEFKRPRLFRHAVDLGLVRTLAARVQDAAAARGWLDRHGRAKPHIHGTRLTADDPGYVSFLAEVLAFEEVAALRSDPGLTDALRRISGHDLKALQADVCRMTFPGETQGTAAHQDAWYCQAPGLWIAWLPLVPCPRRLGSLEVADRETELLPHDETGLSGDISCDWGAVPCSPGDVLLFSGLTPHRSLPNRSADRPRLSLDLRFGLPTG
ncbi:MAG: phytanoyl-CoA dioxygenase family protein [Roseibium sp.]|uniref:phytanoyl-CoA dioxygenase family protein n=1 Tax=Roseibium sp. TaxID=1936156 RepID=UPI003D9C4194